MKAVLIHFFAILFSLFYCSSSVATVEYEEVSYEDLLKELNTQSQAVITPYKPTEDFFDNVTIHAGLGFINSQLALEVGDERFYRSKSGIQLAVGIDLASPIWQLEGAVRNYGQSDSGTEELSLREFDLRIIYQRHLNHSFGYRLGGGLAARYLTYHRYSQSALAKPIRISSSTPSAIAFIGLDYFISEFLSLGVDFNGRSSMIQDTVDQMALDLTFRVDTHF